MAIPKRTLRGLQEIRSQTGKPVGAVVPHMLYMRITCLEMERARRTCERDSAQRRLDNIAVRFREIEAEKRKLLSALGKSRRGRGGRRLPSRPPSRPVPRPATFKVKY